MPLSSLEQGQQSLRQRPSEVACTQPLPYYCGAQAYISLSVRQVPEKFLQTVMCIQASNDQHLQEFSQF